MSRITQIIQNTFIRIEALFGVIFASLANVVKSFFGLFAKVFGLASPNYFVESDGKAEGIQQSAAKDPIQKEKIPETPITFTSRRPNAKKVENYYLNMARDVKKG
ncbi:hypothetical protein [Calothrix sp. PCC 7507]|uniref:hypothetical protein n=1 Tax=Calothrix sp. PCC 7507 TaxID=99598 RepID=UPI00029F26CC|nr:hypothetical protein [Calothrix sp. PCC 7507]AFY31932.1 hypothetical protein Cal7507_1467 [Calothrix sp. PCC 7507]